MPCRFAGGVRFGNHRLTEGLLKAYNRAKWVYLMEILQLYGGLAAMSLLFHPRLWRKILSGERVRVRAEHLTVMFVNVLLVSFPV